MSYNSIENKVLPILLEGNVKKVTLTGGEPFVHKDLLKIVTLFCENQIGVSICTNASLVDESFLKEIKKYDNVHFNVSLDGFSEDSHGKFRGNSNPQFFSKIITNINLIAKYKLLNGILVTPNRLASINEYSEICRFAINIGAKYVLMNPLSQFGRGEDSQSLAYSCQEMISLRNEVKKYEKDIELVYIRFPNENMPLKGCFKGQVLYIFSNGDTTICPYLVFSAKDSISKYKPDQFIIGNVYNDKFTIEESLKKYIYPIKEEEKRCFTCSNTTCNGGCDAAKIAHGLLLNEIDEELCPMKRGEK